MGVDLGLSAGTGAGAVMINLCATDMCGAFGVCAYI